MGSILSLCFVQEASAVARRRPVQHAAGPALAVQKSEGEFEAPLRFGRIDQEDGLPSSTIQVITQDAVGFMWIGTAEGLARFDGRAMKVFRHDPSDATSLSSSNITALAVDPAGDLWIGTDEGLNRYDTASGKLRGASGAPKSEADTAAQDAIPALLIDKRGRLWLGSGSGRGLSQRKSDGTFATTPVLKGTNVTTLLQTHDGYIYVGTDEGLYGYDPDKDKIIAELPRDPGDPNGLSDGHVTALAEDEMHTLWIGTEKGGLEALDLSTRKLKHHRHDARNADSLSNDRILTLLVDRSNTLWIGTAGDGVSSLDLKSGRWEHYAAQTVIRDQLAYHWVGSSYIDRGGVVWLGTLGGGISTFDPLRRSLNSYRVGSAGVCSFVEQKGGPLWLGTISGQDGSGLYKIDRKTHRYTFLSRLEGGGQVADFANFQLTSMTLTKEGRLVIGGDYMGLVSVDPSTLEFKHLSLDPKEREFQNLEEGTSRVYAVAEQGGVVWAGTWGGGLIAYDRARNTVKPIFDPTGLPSQSIYSVVADKKDPTTLWIGMAGGGLSRFNVQDSTGQSFRHNKDDDTSISSDDVASIAALEDGTLWIGTGAGLNHFDPKTGKFKRYGKDEGISQAMIWGVVPDKAGRIWLSTNGDGLQVLDPKTGSVRSYKGRDGVQSNDFAQGGAYADSAGKMYFGGTRGFTIFDPEKVKPDDYTPPVAITGVRVVDKEPNLPQQTWLLPELKVGYKDSVVTFEYAAFAYADPHRNRFLYHIDGLHDRDQWFSTDQPSFAFSPPGGGDYTFRVKAVGRHGATSAGEGASLKLVVGRAPWNSWWAYALYALIAAGIVFAYLRYQAQRVASLEQANRLSSAERELELTAAVQTGCLPKDPLLKEDGFHLIGVYSPAERCSGDWWWHESADNGRHWIVVGDVTGHGAGPAMVTAAVAAAFRAQSHVSPLERIEGVNNEVISVGQGKYHMVLSAVELDRRTGKFIFYSAGGLPVICLFGDEKPKILGAQGTPLGSANLKIGTAEGTLRPGERIVVLTDGLPEIEVAKGKLLGIRKLVNLIKATNNLAVDLAAKKLLEDATAAKGPVPQSDDWTFVVADFKPFKLSDVAPPNP
jgi:ligand-binding sensor domain-containing protein